MKKLIVAVQMDPIESINPTADSTFVLMLEAQKRGAELWYYTPDSLSLKTDPETGEVKVYARVCDLQVRRDSLNFFTKGEPELRSLEEADTVLMRQDPPFDQAYITATHILEHLKGKTAVINDPRAVRNAPEKLLITYFADLMPPTLISRDKKEIKAFRACYKDIIVKPLFGNGGYGIFRLKPDDGNLDALLELYAAQNREPLMIQRFEPAVKDGDKRIILADGEPVGALNRIAEEGAVRSNLHVGGRAEPVGLTERDREICARLKPYLQENGLIFTGIDVIGRYLTEINVTSPTGLQEIARFTGEHPEAALWDKIIERLEKGLF